VDQAVQANTALMNGMFWGGLLMAAVPILLSVGIGIFVLRRYLNARRQEPRGRTS